MLVFWLCFGISSSRVQRSFSSFHNLDQMFVFISDVLMSTISHLLVEFNLVDPPSSSDVFSIFAPICDYVLTFSYMIRSF